MQGRKHPYTVGGVVAESRAQRIDARPYRRPAAEQPVKETASVRFRGALLPERGWIHDPVQECSGLREQFRPSPIVFPAPAPTVLFTKSATNGPNYWPNLAAGQVAILVAATHHFKA